MIKISTAKEKPLKKIEAILICILALAIFISLFVVVINRPFSRPKLTNDEKEVVLELQNKIADRKSIDAIDAIDLLNSQVNVTGEDGIFKVIYQYRSMETHYEVVAKFDAGLNVIESCIYNNNKFHQGLYIVYAFLSIIGSFALAIIGLNMYDDYRY